MDEDFKSELEWAEERLGDLIKYTQGDAFKKLCRRSGVDCPAGECPE